MLLPIVNDLNSRIGKYDQLLGKSYFIGCSVPLLLLCLMIFAHPFRSRIGTLLLQRLILALLPTLIPLLGMTHIIACAVFVMFHSIMSLTDCV